MIFFPTNLFTLLLCVIITMNIIITILTNIINDLNIKIKKSRKQIKKITAHSNSFMFERH